MILARRRRRRKIAEAKQRARQWVRLRSVWPFARRLEWFGRYSSSNNVIKTLSSSCFGLLVSLVRSSRKSHLWLASPNGRNVALRLNLKNSMQKNNEKDQMTERFSMPFIRRRWTRQKYEMYRENKSMPNSVVGGRWLLWSSNRLVYQEEVLGSHEEENIRNMLDKYFSLIAAAFSFVNFVGW